jgi:hypothetical protein
MATVFWIGEQPTQNNPTPNNKSSWDVDWQRNFGGYDDPDPTKRTSNFTPAAFVPKLNPFYIALPYNDVLDSNTTKTTAGRIPWYKQRFVRAGRSIVKGQWLAIQYGSRLCYAQWEDVGPFEVDDFAYVFGNQPPINQSNGGAGIDVSPAVRDYLGLRSNGRVNWRFVDPAEVADGPWRWYGHAKQVASVAASQKAALAARLEELRRMRDEYFRQNGNDSYRNR